MGKDWCDNENLTTTMIFFGFQLEIGPALKRRRAMTQQSFGKI